MASFIIFIILLQSFIIIGHAFVFWAIVSFFRLGNKKGRTVLAFVLLLLSGTFIFSMLLSGVYANGIVRLFYFLSAYYLGFAYFFSISAVLSLVLSYISSFTIRSTAEKINIINKFSKILSSKSLFATFFIIFGLGLSVYCLFNAYSVSVKEINIPVLDSEVQVEGIVGKRIVFLSDMHLGSVYGKRRAEYLRDKIININPDLVLFGGDIFDGPNSKEEDFTSVFSKDKFPFESVYVQGNHEEIKFDPEKYRKLAEKIGIVFLNNEEYVSEKIKNLVIIGTGHAIVDDSTSFEFFLKNVQTKLSKYEEKDYYKILLKHSPEDNNIAEKYGIDLVLSGHTHSGQVWPGNILTRMNYGDFNYGLVKVGKMFSYTSSGAGTWGMPFRLGTRSEIVIVNFI